MGPSALENPPKKEKKNLRGEGVKKKLKGLSTAAGFTEFCLGQRALTPEGS